MSRAITQLIIEINPDFPEPGKIKMAAAMLAAGKLVVFPTETVYGLGANALDTSAVSRVYHVKQRPSDKSLTLHIADLEQFWQLIGKVRSADIEMLVRKFWPGPLTVVVKDRQDRKIGVRMPNHKIALNLIKEAQVPVVAPSANLSGQPAPVNARQAADWLGNKVDLILDGGPSSIGKSSTVIDLTVTPYVILREGAVSKEELLKCSLEFKSFKSE